MNFNILEFFLIEKRNWLLGLEKWRGKASKLWDHIDPFYISFFPLLLSLETLDFNLLVDSLKQTPLFGIRPKEVVTFGQFKLFFEE